MPSTSETGHAKNVANFETMISFCTGYGATYNPGRVALKLPALQSVLTAAKTALTDCTTKQTAFANATDARVEAFAPLKALSTRIVNAFAVSGVAPSVVEGAKTINRKLQGQRASNSPVLNPPVNAGENAPPPPAANSSSQQSYDNLVEHFNALIELVGSHAEYIPNETELNIDSLLDYLSTLRAANTAVINTYTAWSNSRINRDNIMYAETTGLVDIALDVKGYVKSVFNATSMQYGQVKGIIFKRPSE